MIAGLDSLLSALRAAGLTVGATEVLRLEAVFAREPALAEGGEPARRLATLVRAVVVKSREGRETFDRVFAAWLERVEPVGELERVESSVGRGSDRPSSPRERLLPRLERTWRRSRRVAIVVLILTALGFAGIWLWKTLLKRPPAQPVMAGTAAPTSAAAKPAIKTTPNRLQVQTGEATPSLPPIRYVDRWHLPLGLGLFSLSASLALAWLARRRGFFPPPPPFTPAPGPARIFLSPLPSRSPLLLEPGEEEVVAYGIGRFVSEEVTRRLDLPSTVRATVRAGGVPRLAFHRSRFPREVWLWLDETTESPILSRAADEVEATLREHGLPVERASFRGVPSRLVGTGGQVFAPNEVDERRDAAIVAILTDGRLMALQTEGDRRLRLEALLRSLAGWPRLAFFDPSGGAYGLAARLVPHGLAVFPPEGLAAFLGGIRLRRRRPAGGGLALWAAVCALASTPVSEKTALVLRRRLALPVPAWGLGALAAAAPGPAGRLAWEIAARAQLLDRLGAAEQRGVGGLEPESVLGRALTAWEAVYAAEEERRQKEPTPWAGTLAQRRLTVERALLKLWRAPEVAARELHELFSGPLQPEIEAQLRHLAPAGRGTEDQARLPWSWETLRPTTQARLLAMKFGGDLPAIRLRWPTTIWLALGLCAGLGVGGLGLAVARYEKPIKVMRKTLTASDGRTISMEFAKLPAGTFVMGSKDAGEKTEKPAHLVSISEFSLGRAEVTNAQYRFLNPHHVGPGDLPVTDINWDEADGYCKGLGGRLPTEAEWEYAARAGSETTWAFGNEEALLGDYAWYEMNASHVAHPIAQKLPNAWGLYDMSGNVWEWVSDWYASDYLKAGSVNPQGPPTGERRVLRGGSFGVLAGDLRSAYRDWGWPERRNGYIGFRCVLSPRHRP